MVSFSSVKVKVIVRQNITFVPAKYAMARTLLAGEALTVYVTHVTEHDNKNHSYLEKTKTM
jgi:hypothetical protein